MTDSKLDNWNNFCGSNFLKADQVSSEKEAFPCISIEEFIDDEGASKPRLTLKKAEEKEGYLFDLNVTNANFCKNAGIKTPKELINRKLYFKKVNVISPKTKKEVESLRICRIE